MKGITTKGMKIIICFLTLLNQFPKANALDELKVKFDSLIFICDGKDSDTVKVRKACSKAGDMAVNHEKIPWYIKACDLGDIHGCYTLGDIYKQNLGDIVNARKYFLKAIYTSGDSYEKAYAYTEVGRIEYDENNLDDAIKWWKLGCDEGRDDPEACLGIGIIEMGKGNLMEAKKWSKLACANGTWLREGCSHLGEIEMTKGNLEEAKIWYTMAYNMDPKNKKSCMVLGVVEKEMGNNDVAKKWYIEACNGEVIEGCLNLGLMEEEKGNIPEARKWVNKACDFGSNLACQKLVKMPRK